MGGRNPLIHGEQKFTHNWEAEIHSYMGGRKSLINGKALDFKQKLCSIYICLRPLHTSYTDTYIYICIYYIVPLQNPVPVQQPTDAMPRGAPRLMPIGVHCILKCEKYQKRRLESERDYICKSRLIRLLGPYEVLESLLGPLRAL